MSMSKSKIKMLNPSKNYDHKRVEELNVEAWLDTADFPNGTTLLSILNTFKEEIIKRIK